MQLGHSSQEACTLGSYQLSEHPTLKDWSFFIFMPSAKMRLEILGYFELHLPLATVLCLFEGNIKKMRQYLSNLPPSNLPSPIISQGYLLAFSISSHSLCPEGLGDLSPAIHWEGFWMIALTP